MINFIIVDDEKDFRIKTISLIDKIMSNKDVDYCTKDFASYNKEFEEVISSNMTSKIYIMDIDLGNNISGIDIARKIRSVDWDSIIILVTCHAELGYEAVKAQIMLLDFISKYNNCEDNLKQTIKKAVNKIRQKKIIYFETPNASYRIYADDILYIIKDSIERKCIIKTPFNEFQINKTLSELITTLDDRFYLSHRSCLVNTDRISYVNWKENKITFDNNETIDMLSRDRKKGLKEHTFIK